MRPSAYCSGLSIRHRTGAPSMTAFGHGWESRCQTVRSRGWPCFLQSAQRPGCHTEGTSLTSEMCHTLTAFPPRKTNTSPQSCSKIYPKARALTRRPPRSSALSVSVFIYRPYPQNLSRPKTSAIPLKSMIQQEIINFLKRSVSFGQLDRIELEIKKEIDRGWGPQIDLNHSSAIF
jgi:hypothetical protein